MRKAQTALEYLMTYGWAILIVIIVGASLYALGVFSPGTWTGKRTTGFVQFQVVDFKLDTNCNLSLVFENRLGKTVELQEVRATFKNKECLVSTSSDDIGPNARRFYSKDCCTDWSLSDPELRTSYNIIIDMEYEDLDSGLTHIDSGTLFGAAENP